MTMITGRSNYFQKLLQQFAQIDGANDADVQLFTLSLGAINSVTGWYKKEWLMSTIHMVILPFGGESTPLRIGTAIGKTAIGYTQGTVLEGDRVYFDLSVDYRKVYEIATRRKWKIGTKTIFYECGLVEVAGTPETAGEEVNEMLEGDYTTWTFLWKRSYDADTPEPSEPVIQFVREADDRIIIYASPGGSNPSQEILHLDDGTLVSQTEGLNYAWVSHQGSLTGKYQAIVVSDTHPKLLIYKDCALIQTINLNTICAWTGLLSTYCVSFDSTGKYILVTNNSATKEFALFRGA